MTGMVSIKDKKAQNVSLKLIDALVDGKFLVLQWPACQ